LIRKKDLRGNVFPSFLSPRTVSNLWVVFIAFALCILSAIHHLALAQINIVVPKYFQTTLPICNKISPN
jgi:hypothetical protein